MSNTKKKKKTKIDRRCKQALNRIKKHIEKLVDKHLQEMGLNTNDRTKHS